MKKRKRNVLLNYTKGGNELGAGFNFIEILIGGGGGCVMEAFR